MEDFLDGFLGVFIGFVVFCFLTLILMLISLNSSRITKSEKYYNNEICSFCGQIIGD